MTMRIARAGLCVLLLVVLAVSVRAAVPWVVSPRNSMHCIGNSFMQYQKFANAYYHSGIDIEEADGDDALSNHPGVVFDTWNSRVPADDLCWALATRPNAGNSNGLNWVQGHLDADYWQNDDPTLWQDVFVNGNTHAIADNEKVGEIVDWAGGIGDFDHIHLIVSENSQGNNIKNPLSELSPVNETEDP